MTEEHDNRDPLLASMTRRYLDAQNKVAEQTAILASVRDMLYDLETHECQHLIITRDAILYRINEALK